MILDTHLSAAWRQQCVDMTRYLFEVLGIRLSDESQEMEEVWSTFWHPTRIIEWPWALSWCDQDAKIFDIGSDPLFSLLLLVEGNREVTLHHTCEDVPNLGKALLHGVGWVDLEKAWRHYADKLKMVYGYPEQLDLAPEIYDVIFNISVMEHVEEENWFGWMDATWKLLKPGGRLVMTCDYLLKVPESGQVIDIINHPFEQFFNSLDVEFLTPTAHIPWHEDFVPAILEEAAELTHPANEDGTYTVYGFAVRKGQG